uniref:CSON003614 protein n=1 Tax=Culicoides sonorensis TaxID=179676 RepID=A0A336LD43_CULSO
MKYSLYYFIQNSAFINFIIIWWNIFSKMFSVVLSTKRISASFSKSPDSKNENEFRFNYEDVNSNKNEVTNTVVNVKIKNNNKVDADERNEVTQIRTDEFVPERDCKFLLYTRLNPTEPQLLLLNDVDGLKNSFFNAKNPVRLLIHGWLDNGYGELGELGRKAYLQNGQFNVISVDWSALADTPNYFAARSAIFHIGPSIAYWSESINTEIGFYAEPLEDNEVFDDTFDKERKTVKMGGEPSNQGKARGSYKLETHASSPFAMGPIEYSKEVSEHSPLT